MKLSSSLSFAGALFAAATTLSASTQYNIDYVQNPGTYYEFSMQGSVTTDGTLGNITRNNLAAVDLKLTTSDGVYTVNQPVDVVNFDATATGSNLLLTGNSVQNLTLTTDGLNGVMVQLCFDPTDGQDSIYVQRLPDHGYYYYSATALSPISLDRGVQAPALVSVIPNASATNAPEPASIGMMAMAGLSFLGFKRFGKSGKA